jgi:hypothetical protein
MTRYLLHAVMAAALAYTPSYGLAQQRKDERLVEREHLRCLIENLDKYSVLNQEPLVIYLVICPETALTSASLEKLQRNSLPQPIGSNTPIENVLVVNKAELQCLTKYKSEAADKSSKYVKISKPYCN